jgi:UDP-N-acetylglucosamine 4,6-dehydratase
MNWDQHSVLITGGTGSFGQEFIRIMLKEYHPWKLVIFSRDEQKQYKMRAAGFDHPSIQYVIGDVRDESRLRSYLRGISIVVHAAAMKHIPICEHHPSEAIRTNILGSQNVISAAIAQGVWKVLGLSTDKAVNPINLYGATKLCMEKMFVQASTTSGTRFGCCRYGNVLASNGSVVPMFLNQRKQGRLTLTDPRMTRFWLSVETSVRFAISSIEQMHGGEIFVPKIPSMSMAEMAEALAPGCRIENIGMRDGEKLHEVLVSGDESRLMLELPDRYVIIRDSREHWLHGQPVQEGFSFSSETNPLRLTAEDLDEFRGEEGNS